MSGKELSGRHVPPSRQQKMLEMEIVSQVNHEGSPKANKSILSPLEQLDDEIESYGKSFSILEIMSPLVEELNEFASGSNSDYDTDDDDSGGHHGVGAPGSASNVQVVVNIIISFVGAGLLGIPHGFSEAGWLLGSITVTVVSALNLYSMLLLPQIKRKLKTRGHADITSYGDLGRIMLGRPGERLVNLCLGISQAGFATAYLIFIAANLYNMTGIPFWATTLFCVPGLCYLVSLREMKHLAPFSMLANASNFCALMAVLVQDFKKLTHHHDRHLQAQDNAVFTVPTPSDLEVVEAAMASNKIIVQNDTDGDDDGNKVVKAIQWSGCLYIVAITIYSLEGVGLVLSLESSAKNPAMFAPLLKGSVVSITIFMAFFGSAGYMAFGDDTMAPITLNLNNGPGSFVKFSLCLGLYLTYPIMMFPIWNIAEHIYPDLKEDPDRSGRTFRVVVVCFSALVAYCVPDFGKFLSLVGSSVCTILGFILPCYFHMKTFVGDSGEPAQPGWQYPLNALLIFGGALFGVAGTYVSVASMLRGDAEDGLRRLHENTENTEFLY